MTQRGIYLLEDVDRAFGDLEVPDVADIVRMDAGLGHTGLVIRDKFGGRHWKELSLADLENEADTLAFFTIKAFCFYLPAFITAAVSDPVRADLITDYIIHSLVPINDFISKSINRDRITTSSQQAGIPREVVDELLSSGGRISANFEVERWRALTPEQQTVIFQFVAYLQETQSENFFEGELEWVEDKLRRTTSSDPMVQ